MLFAYDFSFIENLPKSSNLWAWIGWLDCSTITSILGNRFHSTILSVFRGMSIFSIPIFVFPITCWKISPCFIWISLSFSKIYPTLLPPVFVLFCQSLYVLILLSKLITCLFFLPFLTLLTKFMSLNYLLKTVCWSPGQRHL